MIVLRNGSKGARFAPFGFVLCLVMALNPTETGYQDIAALLARQPGVAEHWQQHMLGSTRRSLQIASFNLPRPVGTLVPETASFRLASLTSQGVDVTGSLGDAQPDLPLRPLQKSEYPKPVRTSKSDRLPLYAPPAASDAPQTPLDAPGYNASVSGAKTADAALPALDPELEAALKEPRLQQYDAAGLTLEPQADPLNAAAPVDATQQDSFSFQTTNKLFGSASFGPAIESLERWSPGEEPRIVVPRIVVQGPDPELKQLASLPVAPGEALSEGVSIAGKGEVTGEGQRPRTPAERLALEGASRAKAEKCLTEVIYFEARGEAVRGQMAVAQVVMNRAFSGFYPNTVCGVVYQNKHRHLACQFTFACDNVADVVKEPEMWDRAQKIAQATLDGRIWLPEVGKSTHYHAYWVRPSWVAEMKKMYKTGVHTFYRPRAWGDGSEAPSWGNVADTAAISAKLAEIAKSSAEMGETVRR